jgi:hypothetical protein
MSHLKHPAALGFSALILSLGLVLPAHQAHAEAASPAAKSFPAFCDSWMAKLDARQKRNAAQAHAKRAGNAFVIEYTGYSDAPERCEVKPSRKKGSAIGKLVYHELRYRKTGPTARKAAKSPLNVIERVEVLEIFRHDGSRWVY